MGQKVHPNGLRVGVYRDWNSRWFASKKELPELLVEDTKIRKYIKRTFYNAGISRVEIERSAGRVRVIIHTGKPGMVIGKGGAGVEELRKTLEQMTGKQVKIDIIEIRAPELDAQLVAESVAQQLEKRVSARRAMKQAISRAMRLGAKGARIIVSGRIAGAEIARRERDWEGTVPLHTLRADIDYGFAEANTTYGKIGVKVWIYKGEFGQQIVPAETARDRRERGGRRGRGGDRGREGGRQPAGAGAGRGGRGERRGR
ncbi:30S ribosomal protein S3 [Caldinitratiruptor microaerophilus]|uniref:Small ribosomal subunit protein uS3 n=1 Tax=Caldinitratiruptor microaerophilus TaxID=671077 RepID=A0AA35G9L9_9FIRM|nr:30S ribosomal protein S3 [Caldinitratiruptor microaerophilus]BDG62226.1 30S ribosomal protein S3 [Caldinitratiruptor microaerophilus]